MFELGSDGNCSTIDAIVDISRADLMAEAWKVSRKMWPIDEESLHIQTEAAVEWCDPFEFGE